MRFERMHCAKADAAAPIIAKQADDPFFGRLPQLKWWVHS